MKILAIPGSLKSASYNRAILETVAVMLDKKAEVIFYAGYDRLPHFNPDLDNETVPGEIKTFREIVRQADGIIICTPEYAFGLPGALKNALDWTVSSGEFYQKPAALISASPLPSGGDKALSALQLVSSALGMRLDQNALLSIPAVKTRMNEKGEIMDSDTLKALESLVQAFFVLLNG